MEGGPDLMEWTKEKEAQLVELYRRGLPQDEIRHEMRVSATALKVKIRELFGDQRNKRRPKTMEVRMGEMDPGMKRRIVAAYDDHWGTMGELAAHFGIGEDLATEVIKKAKGVEKLESRGSPLLSYPKVPVIGPPVTEMQIIFETKRQKAAARRKAGCSGAI